MCFRIYLPPIIMLLLATLLLQIALPRPLLLLRFSIYFLTGGISTQLLSLCPSFLNLWLIHRSSCDLGPLLDDIEHRIVESGGGVLWVWVFGSIMVPPPPQILRLNQHFLNATRHPYFLIIYLEILEHLRPIQLISLRFLAAVSLSTREH